MDCPEPKLLHMKMVLGEVRKPEKVQGCMRKQALNSSGRKIITLSSMFYFLKRQAVEALLAKDKNENLLHFLLVSVIQFSSVQFSPAVMSDSATSWTAARQTSLSITNSGSLPKLISIELVMPSNHLILCCPLLLLPSIFPSIGGFSNESALCIKWPKYWSFSINISPFNEHPRSIPFRMDWLDLLAIQGTLKSLLQHHSSKAPVLQCSAFFIVQLSHSYMTIGKAIALIRRNFVGKVMSLLFNMLSRLVITFLPRSKHLLISWLQSPSTVILKPPKIKSATVSTVYPSICHDVSVIARSRTFLNIQQRHRALLSKNIMVLNVKKDN